MDMEKIKEWLLNNILTLITIIIPALGGVFAIVVKAVKEVFNWLDIFLFFFLTLIIVSLCVKMAWNAFSYKSYRYPWLKIRTAYNYTVLNKKITYKRGADDTLNYSKKMEIKCCSNRVDYALDKYIWTGVRSDKIKIEPIKGIANIKDKSRIGIWHYFVMELNNHMEKGDKQELHYKWSTIEQCSKSSPFFSTSTDEPTQQVILSLDLGEEYANQEIICEEFRAIESDYPIYIKRRKLDERGIYEWKIPAHKVKRFRHYRIRWSWSKGQPAAEIE